MAERMGTPSATEAPARRRRAIALMLGPVLAVHAGALMLSKSAVGQPARSARVHVAAMPVRLVGAKVEAPATEAVTTAPRGAGERMAAAVAGLAARGSAPARQMPAEQSARVQASDASGETSAPMEQPSHPSSSSASTSDPGLDATDRPGLELEYLPRPLLSVAPRPLASIDIPFPAEGLVAVSLATELSLFIDETGVVRHVRVDGAALPPALEEAARTSFLNARFAPGEVDGTPVRALIRVAVSFDAEAMPPGPVAH